MHITSVLEPETEVRPFETCSFLSDATRALSCADAEGYAGGVAGELWR